MLNPLKSLTGLHRLLLLLTEFVFWVNRQRVCLARHERKEFDFLSSVARVCASLPRCVGWGLLFFCIMGNERSSLPFLFPVGLAQWLNQSPCRADIWSRLPRRALLLIWRCSSVFLSRAHFFFFNTFTHKQASSLWVSLNLSHLRCEAVREGVQSCQWELSRLPRVGLDRLPLLIYITLILD